MRNYVFIALISALAFTSCKKNDPVQEVDQEELSSATLTFTAVEKEIKDGKTVYTPITGEEIESIKFQGPSYEAEAGTHLHLHVGEIYKLDLKTTDFNGKESQQSFLNRPENHQAFLLGTDNTVLDFEYADANNVGITAYITVKKEASVKLNYIMRHVSSTAKQTLKASDWNNTSIKVGAVDLDLEFEAHFIEEEHGH